MNVKVITYDIKNGRRLRKQSFKTIPFHQIEYICSYGDYVEVTTIDGNKFFKHGTMKKIYDSLKKHSFLRVSRTAIVNEVYVDFIDRDSIKTKSKKVFNIGITYKKNVHSHFI